ncbi:hypothetical protein GRI43_11200 [Altererythrobacter luteolus]|uniref:Uncharacterized protein n=1 Tax=Pontixanthobacter luteolus TaxID=295089 RepID=A0A6I4V3M3_9SPHN|nr:hypothetical protein [Pontixanthobacter luteolus]MXP47951.1 hypothetical protein [Pontixanthobacter luteolus]
MHAIENATGRISSMVADVSDEVWRLELAALAAQNVGEVPSPKNPLVNFAAQFLASLFAIATLGWLIVRHCGTSSGSAAAKLSGGTIVAAVHGEVSTRTRHIHGSLVNHRRDEPQAIIPLLLLGRPSCSTAEAFRRFDVSNELAGWPAIRPLSLGSFCKALPAIVANLLAGIRETANYSGRIDFRSRVAIAYRFAQGEVHACWWHTAASGEVVDHALFGHTGTADSSLLEKAMQASGAYTTHVVHGSHTGWSFAGVSDLALFPSGADARLAQLLPGYIQTAALPLSQPEVCPGDGHWALLTSYTHLQNLAYQENGAEADIALVRLVRELADAFDQDPSKIIWRPHPQIDVVASQEKAKLERAVSRAGFSRWPSELPYGRLCEFSVVVTSPSTVLTDALRMGQPAIVASMAPMQRDLIYNTYPLRIDDVAGLHMAISRVLDPEQRRTAFKEAWAAIEPGGDYDLKAIMDICKSLKKSSRPNSEK